MLLHYLLFSSHLLCELSEHRSKQCITELLNVRIARQQHTVSLRDHIPLDRACALGGNCEFDLAHSSDPAEVSRPSRSAMATASSNDDPTAIHLVALFALFNSVLLHDLTHCQRSVNLRSQSHPANAQHLSLLCDISSSSNLFLFHA